MKDFIIGGVLGVSILMGVISVMTLNHQQNKLTVRSFEHVRAINSQQEDINVLKRDVSILKRDVAEIKMLLKK